MTFSLKKQLQWTIGRRILARSGVPARVMRLGAQWRWPWRRAELIVARGGGIGDVLMATPLLREAKRRHPALRTILYTNHCAALVRGLPYIDEVRPLEAMPANAIDLTYEDAIPPGVPLPQILADHVGLRLDDIVPDCVVSQDRIAYFRGLWAELPRPHFVVLRRAGYWTRNKDWADTSWVGLLTRLGDTATIIEIGEEDAKLAAVVLPNYIDMRSQIPLHELPAVIAAADLYIGPVSGPMHVAAAVGTRGVIICGGYEHPIGCSYPGHHMLYTPVPCAPCWLRGPCPNQHACLTAISVADVEAAVWEVLRE
jgi:ADP-heptose:LPS heptosyltransferase